MRLLLYILVIFLLTGSSVAPERIAWSPDRTLQWSDFKGSPTTEEGWAASTSSGMSQSYELDSRGYLNKAHTKVIAHFYPEYSWVRNREKTKHLLAHEQVHFDITELHARKLQDRIDKYVFTSNAKEEVRLLYAAIEEERVAMQRRFDEETNHSMDHTKELQWELKVAKWLKETAPR